jgi:hypothetical protein
MANQACAHINAINSITQPERLECEECVKIGASVSLSQSNTILDVRNRAIGFTLD